MAAPRTAATTGPSIYDRILVMATSAAPAAAAAARPSPAQPGAFAGTQRFIPPRLQQRPEQEQEEADEPDENPPSPPVFTFPAPGQQQPTFTNGNAGAATPGTNVNPPATITINPVQTSPGQPSFPAGVAQPGMIVPPPPPLPPGVRPPGGN
jgi:hypothetical protein